MKIFTELGPWNWWVLGLVLLGLEILAPGAFFIWFGLAAMVVGTISIASGPDALFWGWQVQILVFIVLSLAFAYSGRKLLNRYKLDESDSPDLNDRGSQMIGRVAVVTDAISGGRGRVRLGDSTWSVSGPDMPEGTRVRVTGKDAAVLQVEPE